jgi:hypothetical protein
MAIEDAVDGWLYAETFRGFAKNATNRRSEILSEARGVRRRRWFRKQKPKSQPTAAMPTLVVPSEREPKHDESKAYSPMGGKIKNSIFGWGSSKKVNFVFMNLCLLLHRAL